MIVVQQGSCTLFELYKAVPNTDGSWNAVSAARFDLEGHELRNDGWTSADAAGLPVFPGLVRQEEVAAGEIRHALRFTAQRTRKAYGGPRAISRRKTPMRRFRRSVSVSACAPASTFRGSRARTRSFSGRCKPTG